MQSVDGVGSRNFSQRCSMGLSAIGSQFSFKCIAVLLLSIALFLSALFWILPHSSKVSGFDAEEVIKHAGEFDHSFDFYRLPFSSSTAVLLGFQNCFFVCCAKLGFVGELGLWVYLALFLFCINREKMY